MNQNQYPQDPSAYVHQSVLPHVHLVSSYKFPVIANLQPAQALEYLLNSPKIVNDAAPVAWTYFNAPPADGTVILTWQPPMLQTRLASDGLVWADPEVQYHADVRGYNLEILVHRSGFRYGFEQFTMHARTRYRIVGKAPGATMAFDPSLWIVHYTSADPNHRFPTQQVQIPGEIQLQLQQRSFLEKQGQLLRKEFMLRDRNNWPEVKFAPASHMPGVQGPTPAQRYFNPMQQMGPMARPPQYFQQTNIGVVPPPAKRPRQAGPVQQPGNLPGMPPSSVVPDSTLDDEENTTLGDQLDYLTPKEISVTRYKQHHEWMEEIFSSPYAAQQILPIDLGLGLMGELAPLTEGLLDAPNADSFAKETTDPVTTQPTDTITIKTVPKNYYKLDPEQMTEFEKRVAEYTAKEEAELEKMKASHAKKMADLKRSRTYIKAERRLRDAARVSSRVSNHTDKVDGSSPSPHGLEDGALNVVQDLEQSLGVKFETKNQVVCVDKGGYIEEQPAPPAPEPAQQVNGNVTASTNSYTENSGLNGLIDDGAMDADNTAASLLEQYGSTPLTGTPGASLSVPQISQPQSQSQSAAATPSGPPVDAMHSTSFAGHTSIEVTSGEHELVDLDVEMSGMTNVEEKGEADWVMVEQNDNNGPAASTAPPPTTSAAIPVQSSGASAVPTSGVEADTTTSMFDTPEFGSFDNLDTAGDALADYTHGGDDLGLDLDNSAFGDAFHGTETHHDGTEDV
jgi:hypothetical protein